MSLSGGTAGGKGVDSNAVDTYDSGDEWDIGVGNLIIDLEADLEKDKLEMSGTKDGGGMAAPPSAVAALPDNIKFVSPVSAPQGKESKSKSKRNKNSKDNSKQVSSCRWSKKDHQGRTQGEVTGATGSSGGRQLRSWQRRWEGRQGLTRRAQQQKGEGSIEWEKQERKKRKRTSCSCGNWEGDSSKRSGVWKHTQHALWQYTKCRHGCDRAAWE